MTENIVIMGFMGTGKTSVGRLIAEQLGLEFVDMDNVIEDRTGKRISRIFEEDGEPFFRKLERQLVQELSSKRGLVIACGGGVVLNPANVRDFSGAGLVVCLSLPPEVILERVGMQSHRPLLEGGEKARKILNILKERRDLYESIPCQIDRTHLDPQQTADAIIAMYRLPEE